MKYYFDYDYFEPRLRNGERWFKTSKYSIKINVLNCWNKTTKNLNDTHALYITDVDYSKRKVDSLSVYDKKGKEFIIEIELACSVLPHIEDMIDFVDLLSDQIINEKLERLLKLKAFL
jgi:hypothetical protein